MESALVARFATAPAAYWVARLNATGIGAHVAANFADVLSDEIAERRKQPQQRRQPRPKCLTMSHDYLECAGLTPLLRPLPANQQNLTATLAIGCTPPRCLPTSAPSGSAQNSIRRPASHYPEQSNAQAIREASQTSSTSRRNTQSPGTTRCPGKRRFGPIENHPHAAARKSIVKFHAQAPPPTPAATPQFSLPHILSA